MVRIDVLGGETRREETVLASEGRGISREGKTKRQAEVRAR